MRWRNIHEFWQVIFDVCQAMTLIMLYIGILTPFSGPCVEAVSSLHAYGEHKV